MKDDWLYDVVIRIVCLLVILVVIFAVKDFIAMRIEAKYMIAQFEPGGTAKLAYFLRLEAISNAVCWMVSIITSIVYAIDIVSYAKNTE